MACKGDFEPPKGLTALFYYATRKANHEAARIEGFDNMEDDDHDGEDPNAFLYDPNSD